MVNQVNSASFIISLPKGGGAMHGLGEKPSPDFLMQSLAGGDMAVLEKIYDTYRNDFLRWATLKFQSTCRDDLLDVWHDGMLMFYEQVRGWNRNYLSDDLKSPFF